MYFTTTANCTVLTFTFSVVFSIHLFIHRSEEQPARAPYSERIRVVRGLLQLHSGALDRWDKVAIVLMIITTPIHYLM